MKSKEKVIHKTLSIIMGVSLLVVGRSLALGFLSLRLTLLFSLCAYMSHNHEHQCNAHKAPAMKRLVRNGFSNGTRNLREGSSKAPLSLLTRRSKGSYELLSQRNRSYCNHQAGSPCTKPGQCLKMQQRKPQHAIHELTWLGHRHSQCEW